MADLKQALIWLAEGKKVKPIDFYKYCYCDPPEYFYLHDAIGIVCNENKAWPVILSYNGSWELYEEPKPIPPPEYDEREVRLRNPVKDMQDYIVWDKNGRVTLATWCSDDKCFFDRSGFGFALDVVEYKPLPERDKT